MKEFDELMNDMGKLVDKLVKCAAKMANKLPGSYYSEVNVENGDVVIKGKIKSLRINGKQIRLPDSVMKPG